MSNSGEKSNEQKWLEELLDPCSLEELSIIFSNITNDKPFSDILFKEKYQVLILENLLKWQKPVGEMFQKVIAVCGARPRKFSETENIVSEDSGAPLSLQFDSFLQLNYDQRRSHSIRKINEKYVLYPLSQNIGRKILSMCSSIEAEKLKKFPIITICHAENSKAVVLLGSSKQKKNSRFTITNLGSVCNQEKLPRLSTLKAMHLQGFPSSFDSIETSVFTCYEFLEFGCEPNSLLKPIKDAGLIMECWWSNSSSVLEPLTDDCACFAKIKAIEGSLTYGDFFRYKEIQFIETLQVSLKTGVITWPNTESNVNVKKILKDFINEAKSASFKKEKLFSAVIELQFFDGAVVRERTNLDFTDKLWGILKDCSSCEELIECLEFVYAALEEFLSPPFIHGGNNCTIALAAKNWMEKTILCPVLNSQKALQLLLEIGVEKLRMDYVTLFLSLELIPYECIGFFLQPKLQSQSAVTCLKKLHSVLELTIVCVKQLKLSKDLLSDFVRNTLKYYTSVPDIDLQHVFVFHIPAVKARQLLNLMRPTTWEISFLSSSNGFMKQTVHHYQTTPTEEHVYAPKNYNPTLMLKTASYVYLRGILIEDDLM